MLALCEPPPPGPTISTQPPPLSWSPPPPGWIKVNIDAALSSSKASLAVVARDHHGVAIKAWARIANAIPPLQAEAQALLWVVKLPNAKVGPMSCLKEMLKEFMILFLLVKLPLTGLSMLYLRTSWSLLGSLTPFLLFGLRGPIMFWSMLLLNFL
ncbi:hypothetical protein SO802_002066 [Lithocarpus litseifolius]|uniref:RNase H type-1 domain-containing protein n=1 Tax=Lithocarpus litseifolius TaxID=425828 RepID=A0AAW2DWQ2_9ROSI